MGKRAFQFPFGEVWWCDLREMPDDTALAALSRDEIERASQFVHQRDQRRYLAAHARLRSLLGNKASVAAQGLQFLAGAHGKPYAKDLSWHFNLSHSGDEALVAISPVLEIGVDVEIVREIADIGDLAQQYFTRHELERWSQLRTDEKLGAFYLIWTRKEACVKAAGWGLNLPLQQFEVGFNDLAPRQVVLPLPNGEVAPMTLASFSLPSGSAAAMAWLGD